MLIVVANLIAFALGGTIILWLLTGVPLIPPAAPPASAATVPRAAAPLPAAVVPPPAPVPQPPAILPLAAAPPADVAAAPPPPPAALPVAAPSPAPAPATPAAHGAYVLQIGAYLVPANAMRTQADLKQHGYDAAIVPSASGGHDWQLVQIGAFDDRRAAAEAAATLQHDTGTAPLIIKRATP
jgi:cell division protein FtsN